MVTYTILTAGGARQGSSGHWAGSSSAHSVHPLSFSTAATHTTQPTVWERKPGHEQHGGGLGGLFHHHNSSSSSTCRPRCKLRVALVNDAPYHLEIVAGYMQILGPLSDRIELVWYQAPQITPDGNYTPVRLLEMQGFTQLLEYLPNMRVTTDKPAPCDFAIFISPEYFEHKTKAFLDAAKPYSALLLVHNGGNHANQRLAAIHPRLHFAALAPHVANTAQQALQLHCHWAMATWQYKPKVPCSMVVKNAMDCMHGFAIQGNFESARRNYTRVWSMLQQAQASGRVPPPYGSRPFHLHLVGRGLVSALALPKSLSNITSVHYNLAFPAYYEQIHHAHALLLVLGSPQYMTRKISSTLVSALVSGVPVVADDATLAAYTFLKREHVFYMAPGEDEMAVMLRVLRMSPAEVYQVRQRVVDLATHLNQRTLQLLESFFPTPANLGQC